LEDLDDLDDDDTLAAGRGGAGNSADGDDTDDFASSSGDDDFGSQDSDSSYGKCRQVWPCRPASYRGLRQQQLRHHVASSAACEGSVESVV
jgi:hypothetical protein